MAYFRTPPNLPVLLSLFDKTDKWLIVINADPDAMASAMALRRIMLRKVKQVAIAKINEITRPDNLAMIRYTRISMENYSPSLLGHFDKFAIVDSQPHHHPLFLDIPFSVIIDHHPIPETPMYAEATYKEIHPEYGATSTLMVEHLYALDITPNKLLATAMQFGIKTDTSSFERHCFDTDLRAYQFLARTADHILLSRIARSEYHKSWLEFFARACTHIYFLGTGSYAFIGQVDNPDLLVVIADFFTRVHEITWVAVAGIHENQAVVVFRSDGVTLDVGELAHAAFGALGSGGGHMAMARAEFPLEKMENKDPELFIWQELNKPYQGITAKKRHVNSESHSETTSVENEDWDKGLND